MKGFYLGRLVAILSALTVICPAAYSDSVAKHLKDEYKNKIWFIANFYHEDDLSYNSDGQVQGTPSVGPWTIDGAVKVTDIDVSPKGLRISGQRLAAHEQSSDGFVLEKTKRKVTIEVALDPQHTTEQDLDVLWAKIFITSAERFVDLAPDFWKPCLWAALTGASIPHYEGCHFGPRYTPPRGKAAIPPDLAELMASKAPITLEGYGLVYRIGKGVTPPKALNAPDPQYSEEARHARFQGTVMMTAIVDMSGGIGNILIQRPLGYGLDDKAAEILKEWRFAPALKDGKAVPVQIQIEMSFHLY